ncbi:putative sulfate exporter family transporter [Nocardia sp. CDC159]|uniref:Sulfate exporter family transporter n=1 Tax=Nocardia pulmonis TaxID=2951408 RepID=A0A9X2E4E1_9NOCA|nr:MULTISPECIES: putative sulfate exporter family transporter [Nocardia]MCM6773927.1 putative sulfate exporter family transporter [Nocardia pulmonis]MCM6786814.1 putative sulfate exporter family transporter [Nocardia sp. CDC159]
MSLRLRPSASWLAPQFRPTGGRAITGLSVAAVGVGLATLIHSLFPMAPVPTLAVVLGVIAAHLPGLRGFVRTSARAGLSIASKQVMRLAIVLLGLQLSLSDVGRLGWATAVMVLTVVVVTFLGTLWLGRRIGLPGDQPLLVATGYSICGASAIGAVSRVSGSREEDIADSVAVVTLCGTLAIGVLPLLQHPLGLGAEPFGRWVGASVHDVGQVVAAAQTAGAAALSAAVLVKLMRVVLLAPLVALVAAHRRATGGRSDGGARPPLVPLFVAGFLLMILLRGTGWVPAEILEFASATQGLLLAAALFGLGAMINLSSLTRTGSRMAALGLASWVTIAAVSYAGVLLTT